MNVEPVVDCHVHTPSFLGDTSWKQIALEHRQKEIAFANEIMYGRIEKQAKEESQIKKESREHIKRVLDIKKHTKRLKDNGRLHREMLLRKENELMHARIERARPQYTLKSMKEWYKYHQNFKDGRRVDPTAGHIMKVSSRLLPESLPKVSDSFEGSLNRAQTPLFQSSVLSKGKKEKSKERPFTSPSKLQHSSSMSFLNVMNSGGDVTAFPEMPGFPLSGKAARMSTTNISTNENIVNHRRLSVLAGFNADVDTEVHKSEEVTADGILARMAEIEDLYEEDEKEAIEEDDNSDTECLHSRPFPIPYDHRNCCVQVRVNKKPNLIGEESLEFRVYNLETPPQLLSTRAISESRAKSIINTKSSSMQKVAQEENMNNLRTMLIEMFQEVDDDGNGFLTFDEFEVLMDKMELGVSKQELRFVISEADDNGNGVVDFDEFVPLAVDLIQSFSAKIKAKLLISEEEAAADLELAQKRSLHQAEEESLAQQCLEKLKSFDTHNFGVVRLSDLKRCLIGVSHLGIKEIEINLVANLLPKDSHGRAIYANFGTYFEQARFAAAKVARVDGNKSPICRLLLDMCKKQESIDNMNAGIEDEGSIGEINYRSFTKLLQESQELNLSRLQVLVLMSESFTSNGMLPYYQYVPTIAKTIELMFDPKALRQRAELITKTDLSVDALLEKMPPDALDERLFALFKSHDVDHNGVLNEEEFRRCLDSLDLGLSKDEILLFLISADSSHQCLISFDDFKRFFKENLKTLNSDKHLKTVQNLIHSSTKKVDKIKTKRKKDSVKMLHGREVVVEEKTLSVEEIDKNMTNSLITIFQNLDENNTGTISFTEVDKVLKQLSADISDYQTSVILSEIPIDDRGNLKYMGFIPKLVSLLSAFRAREEAEELKQEKEDKAYKKADNAIAKSTSVMSSIVQYLKQRFSVIDANTDDPKEKQVAVIAAIKNTHSGLTAKEANILSSKFCQRMFGKINRKASMSHKSTGAVHLNIHPNHSTKNSHSQKSIHSSFGNHSTGTEDNHHHSHSPTENHIDFGSRDSHDGEDLKRVMRYCGMTSAEIKAHVYEVRKQSLVRSYLEVDTESLEYKVFSALHDESMSLVQDGLIPSDSKYIPANIAMNTIRYHPDLHLDRSQVFSIMTLADHCYDETHTKVHYVKFAAFAANIILGLHTEDHVHTEEEHEQDFALLNGLTFAEMDSYLQESFAANEISIDDDLGHKHEVDAEIFRKIIKETPKVNYSEKEVTFIVNTFPVNENGKIHWAEYMSWAHGMAHSIANDRLVNRENLLTKHAAARSPVKFESKDANATSPITENIPLSPDFNPIILDAEKEIEKRLDELAVLAQKVMNFVKIKLNGGAASVGFPDEAANKKSANNAGGTDTMSEDEAEVLQILKAAKLVPCINDLCCPSDIDYKTERIACLFNIVAINGVILRISLISIDGRYVIYQDLPISLPSLGLVDNDLAREFASNCADLLYIEKSSTKNSVAILKMRI